MRVATAAEMREIDRRTIDEFGIPGSVLMERAGLAVAGRVQELFPKGKVIVVAGGGNNGGDGIVAGRNLFNRGWNAKVLLLSRENRLSPDCLAQYRTARKMGVPVEFRTEINSRDLHSAIVIDAIMGTGLSAEVKPAIAGIIDAINTSGVRVVAVDIPSGISSDTGEVMGEAMRADYTVTFGLPKRGHFLHPGSAFSGRLFVEETGFPASLLLSDGIMVDITSAEDVSPLIPERPAYSHKGDYGHVFVLAGSRGKTGAALMTGRACLRAGAGLVTIGVPESLVEIFESAVTEEMVLPLPDNGAGVLAERAYAAVMDFLNSTADVLALGPGLTRNHEITGLVRRTLLSSTVPMVIDADAINALARDREILKSIKAPAVLTPHPGEMARLLSSAGKRAEVERDRIGTASRFAAENGLCVVLKGAPTVIASPEGRTFINSTGNPGMATAGSGDVLTGILAGLMGQGLNPVEASLLGVHLHGAAADLAVSEKGLHSMIAGDLIEFLPTAFQQLDNA